MVIVLATDGSESSLRAADCLARLVRVDPGDEVHLLYVYPVPLEYAGLAGMHPVLPAQPDDPEIANAAQQVLRRTQAHLDVEPAQVRRVLRIGGPIQDIAEYARAVSAALIVVGRRGLSGLQEALLGSVSSAVLHRAHCPVLVIR